MTTEAPTKPKRASTRRKAADVEQQPAAGPAETPPFDTDPKASDEPAASELVDRAEISNGQSLIKLSWSEKLVQDMAAEVKALGDLSLITTDKQTEDRARKFRMAISASITALKARCLELRKPAAEFGKLVIAAERIVETDLRAIMAKVDEPLTALDEERRAERERKAAEAETERQRINDAVASISSRPTTLIGKPASEIAEALAVVEAIDITEEAFADRMGDALMAQMATVETLKTMHAAAVQMEEQQATLAAQQAELVRSRSAQSALDAITSMAMRAMGQPLAVIIEMIAEVEAVDVMAEVFAGRDAEALDARTRALAALNQFKAGAEAAEAQAAQFKAQREQLDAQQREQEARQAELDSQEEARRAEAARVEREASERRIAVAARIERLAGTPERLEAMGANAAAIAAEQEALEAAPINQADFEGHSIADIEALKQRVLAALAALHTAAVAAETAEANRLAAERAEAQRAADEEAARVAAAKAEQERQEAIRAAGAEMLDVLVAWRDAEKDDNGPALTTARLDRDVILSGLGL